MSPITPIEFVCAFDTEIGMDGKVYIAKYVDGCLSWCCAEENNSPTVTPKKSKAKAKKYPSISLTEVIIGDVYIGEDGNSYVAQMGKNGMHWNLHTQSFSWNSNTVSYLTINNDDLNNCLESNNKQISKKNKRRSSKK